MGNHVQHSRSEAWGIAAEELATHSPRVRGAPGWETPCGRAKRARNVRDTGKSEVAGYRRWEISPLLPRQNHERAEYRSLRPCLAVLCGALRCPAPLPCAVVPGRE